MGALLASEAFAQQTAAANGSAGAAAGPDAVQAKQAQSAVQAGKAQGAIGLSQAQSAGQAGQTQSAAKLSQEQSAGQTQGVAELSQEQQDDNAAAAAKSMAKSRNGKITEGISPNAMMYFKHKCNSKYDTQMTLNRLGNLYKLMPKKLKREIGQVYYPALRTGLQDDDEMQFLEAEAGKEVLEDGTLRISLSFPKFFLTMDHVSWEDLDKMFLTYFKKKK